MKSFRKTFAYAVSLSRKLKCSAFSLNLFLMLKNENSFHSLRLIEIIH